MSAKERRNKMEWLKGKKTYIVAAAAILTAFGTYLGDGMSIGELITAIYAALATITLRAGVAK